jgi:multiple sugar transport system substrate-binding protein
MTSDRRPDARPGLDRRGLLKSSAVAAALAAASLPWLGRRGLAQADFNWRQFEGEHIEVLLTKNPRSDLLQQHEPEFVELTGIDLGSEQVPEQQQRQKQVIEFTSGATSFDVTDVSWHVQKRLFGKGKWLEDLRPYLDNPALTPASFDFDDFSEAGITYATQADGRIDTLPHSIDYWIIYWNKELFDAKNVPYPANYDELIEAARTLHDPANGVYGWVSRGLKNANTPVWTSLLLGWDIDSVDDQGELQTTTEEAIRAAEIYTELNAQCAPPGIAGFNWYECQSNFMQGNVAMWFDGIGFAPPLEDPTKSRVVGKVGYGVMPVGPRAQHSGMFGTGVGVSAFSDLKEPAYLYALWATDKQNQARLLANGAGSPGRVSPYQDKEVLANVTMPEDWVEALVESGKIGRPGLPVVIPVTEFRDIFGIALTNMIGGADPKTELEKATEQFRPILEKSEQT